VTVVAPSIHWLQGDEEDAQRREQKKNLFSLSQRAIRQLDNGVPVIAVEIIFLSNISFSRIHE
jgi:hypothetical protein